VNPNGVLFGGILVVSVGVLGLLLLLDHLIHRTKAHVLPVTPVKNEPSTAGPVAVQKLEPLPRLEPLAFMDVLRKSLKDYRLNMILFLPALSYFILGESTLLVESYFEATQLPAYYGGVSLIFFPVYFCLFLAQISLTGRVVRGGKVINFPELWVDMRKYAMTVLGIGFVFGIIYVGPFLLSQLLYYYRWTPFLLETSPQLMLILSLVRDLVTAPLYVLIDCAFYVCLAGVGVTGLKYAEAMRAGRYVISQRRSVFIRFFLVLLAVSILLDCSGYIVAGYLESASILRLIFSAVTDFGVRVFYPLWFLIAFRIYWGFKEDNLTLQAGATSVGPPEAISRKQFCTQCGTELPYGSRFCSNCGTRQP